MRFMKLVFSIYMVMFAASSAFAANNDIAIGYGENAATGEQAEIVVSPASAEEIRRDSPMALNSELEAHCKKGLNVTSMVRSFAGQTAMFYLATGLSGVIQGNGDPAAIRHFAQNSLTD